MWNKDNSGKLDLYDGITSVSTFTQECEWGKSSSCWMGGAYSEAQWEDALWPTAERSKFLDRSIIAHDLCPYIRKYVSVPEISQ